MMLKDGLWLRWGIPGGNKTTHCSAGDREGGMAREDCRGNEVPQALNRISFNKLGSGQLESGLS